MTKCEEAQKGIEKMLDKLDTLIQRGKNFYGPNFDYSTEEESLSI
jgi:hypothetical protein